MSACLEIGRARSKALYGGVIDHCVASRVPTGGVTGLTLWAQIMVLRGVTSRRD